MQRILIDSGMLLAELLPAAGTAPSSGCRLLCNPGNPAVLAAQNHLLTAVIRGGIEAINLLPEDYARVTELNGRYADLPGDFADLTVVCLSERLDIAEILTLDSDFDVYRRFRKQPFCRIPLG